MTKRTYRRRSWQEMAEIAARAKLLRWLFYQRREAQRASDRVGTMDRIRRAHAVLTERLGRHPIPQEVTIEIGLNPGIVPATIKRGLLDDLSFSKGKPFGGLAHISRPAKKEAAE